ncbi:nucleotidyltransferase domain-containing protein [Candidatus Bathyarchaeota archaeon]|nr:nucleotidyltransferase domain-containing protein [Candidatus Bathyarchaeota archaeon]
MSLVIPFRVPKKVAERIKRLVDLGVFPSRSDLIREALRRFLTSQDSILRRSFSIRDVASLVAYMLAWNEKKVSDVVLFGSVARGDATVESDIDLLVLVKDVEVEVVRERLYDLIYPIIPVFGIDISLIVVEKRCFLDMIDAGDPFATSILKEGVQLYGGLLDEYRRETSK